jgi:hypothetical protein
VRYAGPYGTARHSPKCAIYHETSQWDKVRFCKNCNGWAQYQYEEEMRDGLFIRRSPEFAYYNRIDRLENWRGRLLGGHREPPRDIAPSSLAAE